MKKLIAIAVLVSALVFAGCAQGQASSAAGASSGSAVSVSASGQSAAASGAATSGQSAVASSASAENGESSGSGSASAESANTLALSVGGARFTVALAGTEAARALVEQLQAGPITVSLHAYGGFEQVGPLPWSLPSSDEQLTTSPGDIMLYQGNQITIFTGSNSWAYTPLGNIEGATPEMLREAFGGDTAEVTISLA